VNITLLKRVTPFALVAGATFERTIPDSPRLVRYLFAIPLNYQTQLEQNRLAFASRFGAAAQVDQ
jgi:hypothetical protein